jgi:guanylate kinase
VNARGTPVVLAAPSGTGKTTLSRRLVEGSTRYVFSTSATTRPRRDGETDGVDYHFVSREDFERRIAVGDFVEWAEVHGRLYGTPRREIEAAAGRGENLVLDIDVQGARQLRESVPEAKLIFVLPPSLGIMMGRLIGRGTESPADVARRLQSALLELQAAPDFDYLVINDDLDECLGTIRSIVENGEGTNASLEQDAEELRAGIARLLTDEYADYVNVTG